MIKLLKSRSLAIGLAMFSMFFGAGNIIFPLAVGSYAGDKNFFAILGLILTAAVMPIAGVIAMILFDGNYRNFFGRIGKVPGFVLALIVISLLGPLGSTPRCIALAYTTLSESFLTISEPLFSAIACGIVFFFTLKKNYILKLLGWVLTPVLLISLLAIIVAGFISPPPVHHVNFPNTSLFLYGLKEGYNTMDLLAAFFFSSTILTLLKGGQKTEGYIKVAFRASFVAAFLLGTIYVGFSYLAARYGGSITYSGSDQLLTAITKAVAGKYAGVLISVTVAFACLTTAIALISSFTEFFQREVLQSKVSYEITLVGALLVTFFISTFQFIGISAFLGPILQICYPGLIVLTFLNILYRLKRFEPIKVPVLGAFAVAALLKIL